MAISIRDETTDSLVRELAGLTGEGITEAIGKAVQERLTRLRKESEYERRKAQVHALTQRIRENMIGQILTDEDLYDESGLPREDA
ncbi:antitoxin VapB [Haloferula luteola]|uniref:Antitoxin VapB n=1 Tax=Haloferula luteola TaxID=595692 RepID=A0A840V6H8_9BACT|nr:type II toxin-antitoxin system VapB family antitoxin [Haloferula luteola]MBB5353867.1 antitoxin VapB [Haloferula luteola]